MNTTILFGNGINRAIKSEISWDDLLDKIKGNHSFSHGGLPNTMTYERIFLQKQNNEEEIKIKEEISEALRHTPRNELYDDLISVGCTDYLTTNYDYAFEKSIKEAPEPKSSEDIYSLRRFREYKLKSYRARLWNIHGEIDRPKSIMLGLDHYCGSVAKLDSYIKGTYATEKEGKNYKVKKMAEKIESNFYCNTSWVDLFFSSNIHIIGLSLDYSETDLWWILNKRARLALNLPIKNEIHFHSTGEDTQKLELLKSFSVITHHHQIKNNDYISAYKHALRSIN